MRRFRAETLYTVGCLLLVAALYLASSGEPVCEGPFILQTEDSYPPTCNSPITALPYAFLWYLAGLTALVIGKQIWRRTTR